MNQHADEICKADFEMHTGDYNAICIAVFDYMNSFTHTDESIRQNLILKKEHIGRVVEYSEVIARSLEVDEPSVKVAQLSALLHDIGRFQQFISYQTYNDEQSVDHAALALQIIGEKGWLNRLDPMIAGWITTAVEYHNKRTLPKNRKPVDLNRPILWERKKF